MPTVGAKIDPKIIQPLWIVSDPWGRSHWQILRDHNSGHVLDSAMQENEPSPDWIKELSR